MIDASWDFSRITGKQEVTDYFLLADIAQRDFAKRFERGELSSRRPDIRTRTARILQHDWATAA
jgi:hypothetical protein